MPSGVIPGVFLTIAPTPCGLIYAAKRIGAGTGKRRRGTEVKLHSALSCLRPSFPSFRFQAPALARAAMRARSRWARTARVRQPHSPRSP